MTKIMKIYMPEDLAAQVEMNAKAERLSSSSYVVSNLKRSMENKDTAENISDVPEQTEDKHLHIDITGTEVLTLKEKAKKLGITPTAWVRNAINTKTFHVINFSMHDLDEFLRIYEENVRLIEGVVCVCLDNHSVFPQDVERIEELMEEITALFKKHFSASSRTRSEVFKDLVKKYEGGNPK